MQTPTKYSGLKSLAFIALLSISSITVAQNAVTRVPKETPQDIQKSQNTSMNPQLVPSTRNKQNSTKPVTTVKPATQQAVNTEDKKKTVKK